MPGSAKVWTSKTARIEPPQLASAELPRRVIDYVVALKPDARLTKAWQALKPVAVTAIKSWNHTLHAKSTPIALNIETKAVSKSWTDGKAQLAIWVDAWLQRLRLLRGCDAEIASGTGGTDRKRRSSFSLCSRLRCLS